VPASADDTKRLGRAVVFVHQHESKIANPLVRAQVEVLLLTGRAMDFAARLKGHHDLIPLTAAIVAQYGKFAGLGPIELRNTVLPALKQADLLDYMTDVQGNILQVEEYVGISVSLTEQTVHVLNQLGPQPSDLAFLHSVEVGAMAPLGRSQHLAEVVKRSFTDEQAEDALKLARAIGINLEIYSADLNESVIFSPYVWGNKQISLAKFLQDLPSNERDALLGMSEQILTRPGISVSSLVAAPAVIRSARNAGLIQAATVHSSTGGLTTYAFSPLFEAEDNQCSTTEALHHRKLFTAHILFGHEKAMAGRGRIGDPAVLVQAMINRGRVGPATNIGTDYHLLEAAGIVAVEPIGDRAFLRLVKPEIAEAALGWIRRITDSTGTEQLKLGQQPAGFTTPEADREDLTNSGEANEILVACVHELRKEMQRVARRDDPWS